MFLHACYVLYNILFWNSTNSRLIGPIALSQQSKLSRTNTEFILLFSLFTLHKVEVVVADAIDYNSTGNSISDEEEYEDGFEIDFIDAYEGQTRDET